MKTILYLLLLMPSLSFAETKVTWGELDTTSPVTLSSVTAIQATIGTTTITSNITFDATSAPSGVSGKGTIYYDSSANVFMIREGLGTPKPIVDPPGNWTCTIRTGTVCQGLGTTAAVFNIGSAACVGNEKMFSYSISVVPPNIPAGQQIYTNNTCVTAGTGLITSVMYNLIMSGQGVSGHAIAAVSVAARYARFTTYVNCCI